MSNPRQAYMADLPPALLKMVQSAEAETHESERQRPLVEIKRRIADAAPVSSFSCAIASGFGMIAEIKECSPSMGSMRKENVSHAAEAYARSATVRAVSVLTNRANFGSGMTMDRLRRVKEVVRKPVLRKDFVVHRYQIYEARAYGADAILLMANVLTTESLKEFYELATELGMDALFEIHTRDELDKIPKAARIYGINSRSFKSSGRRFRASRWLSFASRWFGVQKDLTTDLGNFRLCKEIPSGALKVAESGIEPSRCREVYELGFNAILVGTALLIGPEEIQTVLQRFEEAIKGIPQHGARVGSPAAAV